MVSPKHVSFMGRLKRSQSFIQKINHVAPLLWRNRQLFSLICSYQHIQFSPTYLLRVSGQRHGQLLVRKCMIIQSIFGVTSRQCGMTPREIFEPTSDALTLKHTSLPRLSYFRTYPYWRIECRVKLECENNKIIIPVRMTRYVSHYWREWVTHCLPRLTLLLCSLWSTRWGGRNISPSRRTGW